MSAPPVYNARPLLVPSLVDYPGQGLGAESANRMENHLCDQIRRRGQRRVVDLFGPDLCPHAQRQEQLRSYLPRAHREEDLITGRRGGEVSLERRKLLR